MDGRMKTIKSDKGLARKISSNMSKADVKQKTGIELYIGKAAENFGYFGGGIQIDM